MDDQRSTPSGACANCSVASSSRAHGVDRRTFLSAATLAAVGALLQACTSSNGFFTGPSGGPLTVKLSNFPALANVGGIARVDNNVGAPTALVRTGASTFRGVTMICTHQGATIDVIAATSFRCPNHGALFNSAGVNTGGQATANLATFAATFDGVDTVTIARP
ncbi:MAG TPA: Rieske 2Fe-2S domain-containing protein [Gemmatimonadaceae bacterium]|jgi:Rieske Fe-S protein|nr:Rieske 2Fe-2S domain-containing protein [Gemmatimonadaceae bacterium]